VGNKKNISHPNLNEILNIKIILCRTPISLGKINDSKTHPSVKGDKSDSFFHEIKRKREKKFSFDPVSELRYYLKKVVIVEYVQLE